jgi:hypothetical protein
MLYYKFGKWTVAMYLFNYHKNWLELLASLIIIEVTPRFHNWNPEYCRLSEEGAHSARTYYKYWCSVRSGALWLTGRHVVGGVLPASLVAVLLLICCDRWQCFNFNITFVMSPSLGLTLQSEPLFVRCICFHSTLLCIWSSCFRAC